MRSFIREQALASDTAILRIRIVASIPARVIGMFLEPPEILDELPFPHTLETTVLGPRHRRVMGRMAGEHMLVVLPAAVAAVPHMRAAEAPIAVVAAAWAAAVPLTLAAVAEERTTKIRISQMEGLFR
ncbi:MAG: hypothetical protein WCA11_13480 [Terracidiphilus sp.]